MAVEQINITEQIAPKNAATLDRVDLGLTGNTYSKTEVADQISKVSINAIKGEAITTTSPTAWSTGNPALFEKWDVKTVGTFTNFKNASNVALVVTQADLDSNFVQFWVTNNVSQKVLSAKPAGAQSVAIFDPTDNVKVPVSKAISDFIFTTNLIPGAEVSVTTIAGYYLNSTGASIVNGNWLTSAKINVTAGLSYIYYGRTNIGNAANAIIGYNNSNEFVAVIAGVGINGVGGYPFVPPAGVTKVALCSYSDTPIKLFLVGGTEQKVKQSLLPTSSTGLKDTGLSWGAIGHSIWAVDGTTSNGEFIVGFQTLIKKVFSFTDYANYAYSGRSLAGSDLSDTTSILEKSSVWTSKGVFSLDCITNDFKRDRPIGTTADFLTSTPNITTFYGALKVLHNRLKALNPNYSMVCSNAIKRNTDNGVYTSWSSNSVGHTLSDYSVAMEWVARRLSWFFVDQFRDSGINDDNLSIYAGDGLHLINIGYKRAVSPWIPAFELVYRRNIS